MSVLSFRDVVPLPSCGCVRGNGREACDTVSGCSPEGVWVAYYNAVASACGAGGMFGSDVVRCSGNRALVDVPVVVGSSCGGGRRQICFGSVESSGEITGKVECSIGEVEGSKCGAAEENERCGTGLGLSSFGADGERIGGGDICSPDLGLHGNSDRAAIGLGFVDSGDGSRAKVPGVSLTKTEMNRLSRAKAKARKARKKERQLSAAFSSVDWNADKMASKRSGFFSECSVEVRKQLVETRAHRLTVENQLRVAEMEQKMQVMRLQSESRLVERKFENDRMKVEIEAKKRISEMPGGTVETVVSSGSISPNSSISLAAENKLRKDLADAKEKLAKLGVSSVGESVLSDTERDLRLANFELESIRLKDRSYSDYTFTDSDYKLALQSLRDEYADVLLTNENRIAREAVNRVLDAFVGKIDEGMLEKVVELGYIDGDTLID